MVNVLYIVTRLMRGEPSSGRFSHQVGKERDQLDAWHRASDHHVELGHEGHPRTLHLLGGRDAGVTLLVVEVLSVA